MGRMISRRQFFKRVSTLSACAVSGAAAHGNTAPAVLGVLTPDRHMPSLTARLKFLLPKSAGWQFKGVPRDQRPFPEQASQVIRELGLHGVIGMPLVDCPDLIGCMRADGTCLVTVCSRVWQAAYAWMSKQDQPFAWGFSRETSGPSPFHHHATSLAGWLMLAGPKRDIRQADTIGGGAGEGLITGILFTDGGEIRFSTYPAEKPDTLPPLIIAQTGTRGTKRFCSDDHDKKSSPMSEDFSDRPLVDLPRLFSTDQTAAPGTDRWVPWERFMETAGLCGIRL